MNVFSKLRESSFARGVAALMAGTALSQILTFLFIPIFTRVFGPEQFGISGSFISLANVVVAICALSLPIAIVLPKSEDKSRRLVRLSIYVSLVLSFILLILSLVISLIEVFSKYFIFNVDFLFLLVFICIFSGVYQGSEKWLQRNNGFSLIAKALLLQTVVSIFIRLVFGYYYPTYEVLIYGYFFGVIFSSLVCFYFAKKKNLGSALLFDLRDQISLIKEYKDFPLYRSSQILLYTLTLSLPVVILSIYYDSNVVGFFTLSVAVLAAPANLISKAVGDVLYPKLSSLYNSGSALNGFIIKYTLLLIFIGLVPLTFMLLFSGEIFSLVFGEEWFSAGEIAKWLSVYYFVGFINSPAVQSIPVLSLERRFFIYSFFVFLMIFSFVFYFSEYGYSYIEVIKFYSLSYAASGMMVIIYIYMVSIKRNKLGEL